MQKKIEHVMIGYAFNYTNSGGNTDVYECFDWDEKLRNKQGLLAHKKDKHGKVGLCSHLHVSRTIYRFSTQQ